MPSSGVYRCSALAFDSHNSTKGGGGPGGSISVADNQNDLDSSTAANIGRGGSRDGGAVDDIEEISLWQKTKDGSFRNVSSRLVNTMSISPPGLPLTSDVDNLSAISPRTSTAEPAGQGGRRRSSGVWRSSIATSS